MQKNISVRCHAVALEQQMLRCIQ